MKEKRCRKCYYRGRLGGAVCCDYLTIEGRSRIFQIPKEERKLPCRFFVDGKRKKNVKRLLLGG